MIIPKTFTICSQKYKVSLHERIVHIEDDIEHECNGLCLPSSNEIRLNKLAQRDRLEQVYLHELIHAILAEMGHETYHDECFVGSFSNMLHQVMTTSKGEL